MKLKRIDELVREYSSQEEAVSEQDVIEHLAIDEKELDRRKRHHVHFLWIVMVWVMCVCLLLACVVVTWHLLMPGWMRWLPEAEVKLLATGAGTAILGYLARSVQKFI